MGLAGSGKRFTIQGVRLFTMRDGKIAHERRYYDFVRDYPSSQLTSRLATLLR